MNTNTSTNLGTARQPPRSLVPTKTEPTAQFHVWMKAGNLLIDVNLEEEPPEIQAQLTDAITAERGRQIENSDQQILTVPNTEWVNTLSGSSALPDIKELNSNLKTDQQVTIGPETDLRVCKITDMDVGVFSRISYRAGTSPSQRARNAAETFIHDQDRLGFPKRFSQTESAFRAVSRVFTFGSRADESLINFRNSVLKTARTELAKHLNTVRLQSSNGNRPEFATWVERETNRYMSLNPPLDPAIEAQRDVMEQLMEKDIDHGRQTTRARAEWKDWVVRNLIPGLNEQDSPFVILGRRPKTIPSKRSFSAPDDWAKRLKSDPTEA